MKGPGFKGRYVYAKLVYEYSNVTLKSLPSTSIPRGGWYWIQDVIENLPKYPLLDELEDFQTSMWLARMSQKVGMCVPSGCSALDVYVSYRKLYEHISGKLEKTTYTEYSLTEDYFFDEYYNGTTWDGNKSLLPEYWTGGQWLYV